MCKTFQEAKKEDCIGPPLLPTRGLQEKRVTTNPPPGRLPPRLPMTLDYSAELRPLPWKHALTYLFELEKNASFFLKSCLLWLIGLTTPGLFKLHGGHFSLTE